MALTERTEISSCDVLVDGQIQVRTDSIIERDGVEISRIHHRHVIVPGDDVSIEDAKIRTIAGVVHTADVISAYKASLL